MLKLMIILFFTIHLAKANNEIIQAREGLANIGQQLGSSGESRLSDISIELKKAQDTLLENVSYQRLDGYEFEIKIDNKSPYIFSAVDLGDFMRSCIRTLPNNISFRSADVSIKITKDQKTENLDLGLLSYSYSIIKAILCLDITSSLADEKISLSSQESIIKIPGALDELGFILEGASFTQLTKSCNAFYRTNNLHTRRFSNVAILNEKGKKEQISNISTYWSNMNGLCNELIRAYFGKDPSRVKGLDEATIKNFQDIVRADIFKTLYLLDEAQYLLLKLSGTSSKRIKDSISRANSLIQGLTKKNPYGFMIRFDLNKDRITSTAITLSVSNIHDFSNRCIKAVQQGFSYVSQFALEINSIAQQPQYLSGTLYTPGAICTVIAENLFKLGLPSASQSDFFVLVGDISQGSDGSVISFNFSGPSSDILSQCTSFFGNKVLRHDYVHLLNIKNRSMKSYNQSSYWLSATDICKKIIQTYTSS